MERRKKMKNRVIVLTFAILLLFTQFGLLPSDDSNITAQSTKSVYLIPVKQGIEQGLFKFMERAFMEAETNEADAIVLEIDTPGGEINAAGSIGKLIREAKLPVVALIVDEAFSAGTYIALNADTIVMTPGSVMGSAAPIDLTGNMAEEKIVSGWSKKMTAAAKLNGRDEKIAEAMVNPNVEIPGLSPKGSILSLDARSAQKVGYADFLADHLDDALEQTGYAGASVVSVEPNIGEKVARLVTNPLITPILLTIGLAGVAMEVLIPGFGIPGVVGVGSFGLYFFGHYIAGFADWLHIVLFVLGVILLLIEILVPGFGIFGAIGVVSIMSGIVMAAYDTGYGLQSLGIAFLVTLVVSFFVIKYFGHRGIWNKFILRNQQKNEQGYTSSKNMENLLGKEGTAETTLRPSGTAILEGEPVDVVTEGSYIEKGSPIKVVRVEGTRVVVRQIKE
jgi:membrane-bound serine protease (ClpP class)